MTDVPAPVRYILPIDIDGGDEAGDDLVLSANLPTAYLGVLYTAAGVGFSATGGTTPYTFTLAAGALPTGLTLHSDGPVTGTPTSLGANHGYFEFTITVTDSTSPTPLTETNVYAMTVQTGIAFTGAFAPGEVGISYSSGLSASGGTPPYTWSLPSGTLPPGTGPIDSSTGLVPGTPTTPGTYNFTVRATDSASVPQDFPTSITIAAALDISTTVFPDGLVGTAYSAGPTVTGGVGTITYSYTGTPPPGLTFSPSSGFWTGTPTTAGPYSWTLNAVDSLGATSSASLSVTIAASPGGSGVATVTGLVVDNTDPANPVVEVEGSLTLTIGRVGGAILSSGATRTFLIPAKYANASNWKMACDPNASCSLDIWVHAFGGTFPTVSDSIVNGNYPAIASGNNATGTTSGWSSTSFTQFAYITFQIRTNDFATTILFELEATRTL